MLGLRRSFASVIERISVSIPKTREQVTYLRKEYGHVPVSSVTVGQLIGGMRGVKGLFTETSKLDAYEGIRFRGMTIPECMAQLPKRREQPLSESIFYLLLTGEVPTEGEVEELRQDLVSRMAIPSHTEALIRSLPKDTHPMTMLSAGLLSIKTEDTFEDAIKSLPKAEYWKPMLEDSFNLVAKVHTLAALIYQVKYLSGVLPPVDPSLDLSANFSQMMGYKDEAFWELMRLYMVIHSDHEGGNVSAHATHLVGSALADAYSSFSAGINGLAGPLHGLANQECLKFLLKLQEQVGDNPTDEQVEAAVKAVLAAGQVVPGYGHAVLRSTDPRFLCQKEFSEKHMPNDPLCRLIRKCYKLVPGILTEQGKAANPWPNVDAHSGALLYYFNFKQYDFYTVLFGVSRALGCMSSLVWSRGLQLPIERPNSMTLDDMEREVKRSRRAKALNLDA
jgi:citrate synthase